MKKVLYILAYMVCLPILAILAPIIKYIHTKRLRGKILVEINGKSRLMTIRSF